MKTDQDTIFHNIKQNRVAENSKIEWTHHTVNPWWGCTKVHAGCDHCYAETFSHRWGHDVWGNDKPRKLTQKWQSDLCRYQKLAAAAGEIHRVFIGSMMDIFEKPMPVIDKDGDPVPMTTGDFRGMLFHQISSDLYPNLMFLFLTKRPSNINKMIPEEWKTNPPANVMFGTSPVDQATANTLIPQLLQVNGKRFLSIEPQLGKVELDMIWVECPECKGSMSTPIYEGGEHVGGQACSRCLIPYQGKISGIHWVIVGGESGHGRRPFDPDWARSLREECSAGKIPFFMKQWDKVIPIPDDLLIRQFPNSYTLQYERSSKKST